MGSQLLVDGCHLSPMDVPLKYTFAPGSASLFSPSITVPEILAFVWAFAVNALIKRSIKGHNWNFNSKDLNGMLCF